MQLLSTFVILFTLYTTYQKEEVTVRTFGERLLFSSLFFSYTCVKCRTTSLINILHNPVVNIFIVQPLFISVDLLILYTPYEQRYNFQILWTISFDFPFLNFTVIHILRWRQHCYFTMQMLILSSSFRHQLTLCEIIRSIFPTVRPQCS